ncbi:hypothetical protein WN51_09315 [Melipona quadrifasciata]|uniref:Uncharacterized protein n=1 Tax=Melipona quadrifasciata TaxID=166423 RepID=A0A0M9A5I5_9HYME|nr:hypothetical protein WN51_09315 [Melipona quadrifasciata]
MCNSIISEQAPRVKAITTLLDARYRRYPFSIRSPSDVLYNTHGAYERNISPRQEFKRLPVYKTKSPLSTSSHSPIGSSRCCQTKEEERRSSRQEACHQSKVKREEKPVNMQKGESSILTSCQNVCIIFKMSQEQMLRLTRSEESRIRVPVSLGETARAGIADARKEAQNVKMAKKVERRRQMADDRSQQKAPDVLNYTVRAGSRISMHIDIEIKRQPVFSESNYGFAAYRRQVTQRGTVQTSRRMYSEIHIRDHQSLPTLGESFARTKNYTYIVTAVFVRHSFEREIVITSYGRTESTNGRRELSAE